MKNAAKTLGTLGLVGGVVMSAPFAMADDSGWYIGGNIGQSRAKIDDARITSQLQVTGITSTTISDDDRGTGYKLFGGYQYDKRFSLEGGYFDLGQFGYTATTVPAGTLVGEAKIKGLNLDLVGMLPVNDQFSAFGRLGMIYAQTKDRFSNTGVVPVPANANPSKSAMSYKFGAGLQYKFSESFGMRAEAERYRVDDAVGNKGDIDLVSVGLVYWFGEKKPAPVQKATPAPVAAPIYIVVPVKVKTQEYCSILDIQFEIKQDEIQREEKEKLAVVGTFMNKYPDTTAVIEGHSDRVGTDDYNMKLSQRRAESVVTYLVDELHIARDRLSAVGYGERRPIADNSTAEGQQANRRINAVIACVRDVAGLKVAAARMTMALEVDFDPYKSEVEPQYYDGLREVAKFMKANPAVTATVEGHAAKHAGKAQVGAEDAMAISSRRAQSVVDYLVDKEGISRSRLSAEAFGGTRRVAYGTTLEGQQENRRVNIIFNYPKR